MIITAPTSKYFNAEFFDKPSITIQTVLMRMSCQIRVRNSEALANVYPLYKYQHDTPSWYLKETILNFILLHYSCKEKPQVSSVRVPR